MQARHSPTPAPAVLALTDGPDHELPAVDAERLRQRAIEVLEVESQALLALREHVGENFVQACRIVLGCRGRVVVSGIGKSGHIARKIAATLASTGTPAFFLHPAEASHGDLGMVTRDDVFIALSNSGASEELMRIVPAIKRFGARLIAMTGVPDSPLASWADVHLYAGAAREACPLNLAPTASTTAALALGDALAVALLEARGFGSDDFARSHPGGRLGRRLLTLVSDVMRTGEQIPRVPPQARFPAALLEISRKRMGMVAIADPDDRLLGIFTDGDLRRLFDPRAVLNAPVLAELRIDSVMHRNPVTTGPDVLAAEAVRLMEERRIGQLLVVDSDGRLVGALHLHDLLDAKVV